MATFSMWHFLIVLLGVSVREGWSSPLPLASPSPTFLQTILPTVHQARYTCLECKAVVAAVDGMLAVGATVEEIEDFVILECINLELFTLDVCEGMVRLAGGEVLYVLNNTRYDYDTICGWLLTAGCESTELDSWTLDIPDNKPPVSHPEPQQPPASTLKILHLSDLHVDLLYEEGSATTCDHPNCCRHYTGMPGPGQEGAGHWGSLASCDVPLHTVEDLIAQAAAIVQPDLVYVTGDLPAHDVWAQTHESNLLSINITLEILKQHFPDIPVVNTLGNHASAPVNSFVVPAGYDDGWNMDWLYEGVLEMWSQWQPGEVAEDVRRGGFFTYSPMPGLRVISINMNYCNTENWWLLLENADPTGELQWLVDTLAAAEASGELVHILGHIPIGGGCEHTWSHILNQIIVRYESTVRAMFFGHTHWDGWEVMYDPQDYTRPVAVSFICPAGTTETFHHPAFKVYTVDGGHAEATWSVIDAVSYNMNLTEANAEGGTPEYRIRYSARDSYGISSMTPANIHQTILNMVHDVSLLQTYEWNTNNDWADVPSGWSCDKECLKGRLCDMVSSDTSNNEACQRLQDYIDSVYPD